MDASIDVAKSNPNVYLEISAIHAQHPNGTLKYPGGDAALGKMVDAGMIDRVIWASDANHQNGTLLPVLTTALQAMIDAGFTDEERCMALSGTARRIFGLEGGEAEEPSPSPMLTSAGSAWFPTFQLASLLSRIFLPIVALIF